MNRLIGAKSLGLDVTSLCEPNGSLPMFRRVSIPSPRHGTFVHDPF